jgi:hypothetical protein
MEVLTLDDLENQLFINNFKRKEDKFFGTIINNTPAAYSEVIYGNAMSGVKGFYATAVLSFTNPPPAEKSYIPAKAELFSVSSEYVESSY